MFVVHCISIYTEIHHCFSYESLNIIANAYYRLYDDFIIYAVLYVPYIGESIDIDLIGSTCAGLASSLDHPITTSKLKSLKFTHLFITSHTATSLLVNRDLNKQTKQRLL